jgi:transposase
VRATTLLKKLLGLKHLVVEGFGAENDDLVIHVRPSWHRPRCSGCRRRGCSAYDHRESRIWRHLDFAGVRVLLQFGLRRVICPRCGIVVERVPWADDVSSRFTRDFENQVTYMAQRCDKTSIQHMFGIAWRTVGRIIERVVNRKRPGDPLDGLQHIGVDELSYRKHSHYITLVTDHDERRIVWGKEGKNAETLAAFFAELGDERCRAVKAVTIDMSGAYIKAVREAVPNAQLIFDRFHVQALVSAAVDETRRAEWRRLLGTDDGKLIKNIRWATLKNPWNLTQKEAERLSGLPSQNARLYRAYLLKESFAAIMDRRQPNVAKRELESWLSWASRSRLAAFVRVAKTIRKHIDDIIAYIRWRLTNGLIEGLNNKARLLTRRAYGFHSAAAVISMIMLCCTGLDLQPVTKAFNL